MKLNKKILKNTFVVALGLVYSMSYGNLFVDFSGFDDSQNSHKTFTIEFKNMGDDKKREKVEYNAKNSADDFKSVDWNTKRKLYNLGGKNGVVEFKNFIINDDLLEYDVLEANQLYIDSDDLEATLYCQVLSYEESLLKCEATENLSYSINIDGNGDHKLLITPDFEVI